MAEQELVTQKFLQEQQQPEVQEVKRRANAADSINRIASIFMLVVVVGFGGTWLYTNREAVREATSRENVARGSVNLMLKASGKDTTIDDIARRARVRDRKIRRDIQRKINNQFK